ncbi:MAG: YerC/YecD family TrpR-related protein [Pseudomonadota bacterium]
MKPNREESPRRQLMARKHLAQAFTALDDVAQTQALLTDLCTPAELQALADRWQVVQLLKKGLAYRAINAQTGVSVTTVGRVARFMSDGAGGYDAALTAIERNGR